MYQIAIIGAGQLGSRHLQALARLTITCEITVIDPSSESLAVARHRFDEVPTNEAIRAVRYCMSINELPAKLDYVIVATTADVRLHVLQSLLARSTVRFMLLEKVLFQKLGDYAIADTLLKTHAVLTWVNCPRRTYPLYDSVQEFFDTPLRSFQVSGGSWGLGCNSIHFIDLLSKLTGMDPTEMSAESLDPTLIPSKRANFMEFTGSLRGKFGVTQFELTSLSDSTAKLMMVIRSDQRTCVIDESGGVAFLFDGSSWEEKRFNLPFLSETATLVATRILREGSSDLATYEQSARCHLLLLKTLSAHAAKTLDTPADYCPIT